MKLKVFVLLCSMMLSTAAFAQEHLKFKGLPVDGKLTSFCQQLEKKGFTEVDLDMEDNVRVMAGEFAGEDCTVIVMGSAKEMIVSKVIAFTDGYKGWGALKNDYQKFVDLYTQKYGEPEEKMNRFVEPYSEGDNDELKALSEDKCVYMALWTTDEGSIALEITKNGEIQFTYEDKVNFDKYYNDEQDKKKEDI